MTPIVCEPLDYASASDGLIRAHEDLGTVSSNLLTSLESCGGMAGWDSIGQEFTSSYDDATGALFVASSHAVNAAGQLVELLHAAGYNHAGADNPSGTGPKDFPSAPGITGTGPSAVQTPPTASGSGADPPFGWGLVDGVVGRLWPNGDQCAKRDVRPASPEEIP